MLKYGRCSGINSCYINLSISYIKILSLMAVYKLSSALLEPSSDKVVNCLNEIGSVLVILLVTLLGIAMLFFLTIALLIGLGNITVMMR